MRFVPPGSLRLPVLLVGLLGALGLAAITLVDRGSSWMHASPGRWFYWCATLAPLVGLLLRAVADPPLRLPARPWLALTAAAAGAVLLSALASPWRPVVLLWSLPPLAGLALFLLVHDWLHAPAENRRLLETLTASAAALLMLASVGYWLVDLAQLSAAQRVAPAVFEMRNPHPLGHSNYTAGLALLGLPALAVLAWRQRQARRGIFLAGLALGLLVLFTSGSRGGLLGLAALGLAGLAAARLPWRRLLLYGALAIVAVAGLALANPRVRALLAPPDPAAATNLSTVQRSAMLTAGLRLGAERPLVGWGLGATPLAYPRVRAGLDGGADNVLQLHSTPLELWAGLGAPGVLLLLGFAALALRGFGRDPVAGAALAGYGALALTDYQLDVPVFSFGLALYAARLASPAAAPAGPRSRGLIALMVVAALGLVGWLGGRDRTPELNAAALLAGREEAGATHAIALLQESLALNPAQEIAHFNLGWLLVVRDPPAAEQHFRAAAHLVPDKGGVYFGLGLTRLNQGDPPGAANALALECLNDPAFLGSPWWRDPAIAALRDPARTAYARLLADATRTLPADSWPARQAGLLAGLAPRLGEPTAGPERVFRRERTGYPVLMRNHDLAPPQDLFVVREDPGFPGTVDFPLPPKGWLPSPRLLKLLDAPPATRQ